MNPTPLAGRKPQTTISNRLIQLHDLITNAPSFLQQRQLVINSLKLLRRIAPQTLTSPGQTTRRCELLILAFQLFVRKIVIWAPYYLRCRRYPQSGPADGAATG